MGGGHNLEVLLDEEDDEGGSNVVVALRLDIATDPSFKIACGGSMLFWSSNKSGHRIWP